jgi:hypothetical protein
MHDILKLVSFAYLHLPGKLARIVKDLYDFLDKTGSGMLYLRNVRRSV